MSKYYFDINLVLLYTVQAHILNKAYRDVK